MTGSLISQDYFDLRKLYCKCPLNWTNLFMISFILVRKMRRLWDAQYESFHPVCTTSSTFCLYCATMDSTGRLTSTRKNAGSRFRILSELFWMPQWSIFKLSSHVHRANIAGAQTVLDIILSDVGSYGWFAFTTIRLWHSTGVGFIVTYYTIFDQMFYITPETM